MTAILAAPRTMNQVVRAAVERAGLRRKRQATRFMVIPNDTWLHQRVPGPEPVVEPVEDYYHLDHEHRPMSRATATGLGGFAASVVSGVLPSLVVSPVAGVVAGVAAGVFGGLMGRSLAEEAYERKTGPSDGNTGPGDGNTGPGDHKTGPGDG
ncbi:hypothetical protein [Amycolatopsis sp. 195334CR]|uniref:hypothetical protein n=1 Tax=Amycolatopsis sp. 195334CR TaxID=2814588 RepID=UPI001A8C577A|nr:hypothetical protein [Amycolatopsis sp. 195334CR]MBN6035369.1 hypothetical protein [Amycolatopsis sp. 195334CR]